MTSARIKFRWDQENDDDNKEIDAEIFKKPSNVLKEAREQHNVFPCLWLRGDGGCALARASVHA